MPYAQKNRIPIGRIALASAILFFPLFTPVHAQIAGLTVRPAIIEPENHVEPGSSYSTLIRVTNLETEKTFGIFVQNIKGIAPDGTPLFAEAGERTGYEVSDWVRIGESAVTIAAGETKEIPVTITVPADAPPGGHYGALFFSRAADQPDSTGVGIGYQVGTILSIRVAGDVDENARIREFITDKALYSKPHVEFLARVENLGTVIVRPRGPVTITNMLGKEVAVLRMNDVAAAVFPQSMREFKVRWEDDGLAFGRYQATIGLVYGEDGRKTITSTASFWILPLHIILPAVGVIIGGILGLLFLIRRHVQKKVRELAAASGVTQPASMPPALMPQEHAPLSRLAAITIAALLFSILFLVILFFLFA